MFKAISINDYKKIKSFLNLEFNSKYIASELQFQNIFAWKEVDNLLIHFSDNYAVLKGKNNLDFFFPPLAECEKSFLEGLNFIENYCSTNSIPVLFHSIPEIYLHLFEKYKLFSQRNFFEYIHYTKDLIELKGKRYHAKRNHIAQFLKNYSYEFLPYKEDFRKDIENLIDFWNKKHEDNHEKEAIFNILDNLEALECYCDCIFIDNYLCGFAIGFISNNVGIILFEKANTTCTGIYSFLENLFIKKNFSNTLYINRQEDMGIASLRKSKLSLHPEFLEKKYLAVQPLKEQLYNLYSLGFPEDSLSYKKFFFEAKIKNLKYKLLKKKNIVLSMFFFKEQTLSILNTDFKTKFISTLTTHPIYQKKHLATKLICSSLNLFSKNTDFVVLHPTNEDFYKKFGFITYSKKSSINFNSFERFETNNVNELKEFYDLTLKNFDVYTKRSEKDFKFWYLEILSDQGKVYKLKSNNKSLGYAVCFDNQIEEFCLTIQENSTFSNMIRICNVISILQNYPYKNDFSFSLKINDKIIHKNNITIKISHENGLTNISKSIFYDFEVSIETLTELLILGKTSNNIPISKYFQTLKTISLDKY
ncbi:MAG: GNAT family N-acetyltransferase [Bacilli bacterium]